MSHSETRSHPALLAKAGIGAAFAEHHWPGKGHPFSDHFRAHRTSSDRPRECNDHSTWSLIRDAYDHAVNTIYKRTSYLSENVYPMSMHGTRDRETSQEGKMFEIENEYTTRVVPKWVNGRKLICGY